MNNGGLVTAEEQRKLHMDRHKAGVNLADQLAVKINWISPFDLGVLRRAVEAVQIGVSQGPMDLPTATLVLSGEFKAEGGGEETGGLRVEHADTVHLLLIEKLGLNSFEKAELHEIVQVTLRALGWEGQQAQEIAIPNNPGKSIRWTWPYRKGGRVKTPAEMRSVTS